MNTEGTDIGSGLTAHPKYTQVTLLVILDETTGMDGADTQLTLDSSDQRRTLEEGSSEGREGSLQDLGRFNFAVEADDADVLFTGTLLAFHQASRTISADDQAASDFGVKSSTMPGLFNTKNTSDPGDNFVGRGVGGLVQVHHTILDIRLDVTLQGAATDGEGRIVPSANIQLVVILRGGRGGIS